MNFADPYVIVASIGAGLVTYYVIRSMSARAKAQAIASKGAKRRAERDEARGRAHKVINEVYREVGLTREREEELCFMTATQMLAAMASGKTTSLELVTAHCRRALQAGEELGTNAGEHFEEAIAAAREADKERKAGWNSDERPLLGLPMSVKDQFEQRGADCGSGLACRAGDIVKEDGYQVGSLRKRGAIPFVRTNVPQMLMMPNAMGTIWGTCMNPWNRKRSPGGSSGGEGALISSRASPVGIGTDIGGSVRIPALCCGLFGFKPTPQRLPNPGLQEPAQGLISGNESVPDSYGPLARDAEDLELIMGNWLREGATDPACGGDSYVPMVPWDYEKAKPSTKGDSRRGKLRIGYYVNDDWFAQHKAGRRAVREAVEALKKAGHELIEMDGPVTSVTEIASLIYGLLFADKMTGAMRALEGEELCSGYAGLRLAAGVPEFLRPALASLLNAIGWGRMAILLKALGARSASDFWVAVAERKRIQRQWEKTVMVDLKLDCVLAPGIASQVYLNDISGDLGPTVSYTFVYNFLAWPCGNVPITLVRDNEQVYEDPDHNDPMTWAAKANAKDSAGMPVGVQIAAPPYQDELVFRVMKDLRNQISFTALPQQGI
eukprot:Clim_evm48s195 gene=Clim_evmTU48s195